MMKRITRIILLFIVLLPLGVINAQREDFQTRSGVLVSGDMPLDFSWEAKVEQRWYNNSSQVDRTVFQGGVGYSPISFLDFNIGYRGAVVRQLDGNAVYKQRYNVDARLFYAIDRLKFSYRSRWQYGIDDFRSGSLSEKNAFVWRHRLEAKYHPFGMPFRVGFSTEIFDHVNTNDSKRLKGIRYKCGVAYLLNKHLSVEADYAINKELNEPDPLTEYILYCGVKYQF